MAVSLRRLLSGLSLEERILLSGALLALIGVFLPWISGEWLGGERATYVGVKFLTGMIGWMIVLLQACVLAATCSPLAGGPVLVRRRLLPELRLCACVQATVLALAALTVLTSVTFEFSRMELRFGLYLTIIGCLLSSLYAFLEWQQSRRRDAGAHFRHPEAQQPLPQAEPRSATPPPPPPPPPLKPEEHHLR